MWAPQGEISLSSNWSYSDPIDNDYIKLVHQNPRQGEKFVVGQASFPELDNNVELFDLQTLDYRAKEEILYFKKPGIFTNRRLAFRKLKVESPEAIFRRVISQTFQKPELAAISGLQRAGWKLKLFVSDFIEPSASTGSGTPPPASKLYQELILENNPYLYYRAEEATGTVALDSSTNSFNGTYIGDYTLGQPGSIVKQQNDKAVKFNGTTGRIKPNHPAIPSPSVFTVVLRFKVKPEVSACGLTDFGADPNNPNHGTHSGGFWRMAFSRRSHERYGNYFICRRVASSEQWGSFSSSFPGILSRRNNCRICRCCSSFEWIYRRTRFIP